MFIPDNVSDEVKKFARFVFEEAEKLGYDGVSMTINSDKTCFRFTRGEEGPNDPKLSDGGGWRDGCAGEGGGAASVTAGAVRCSAWLGVAAIQIDWERALKNNAIGFVIGLIVIGPLISCFWIGRSRK